MTDQNLAPCPFCGGEASIAITESGFYVAGCGSCGVCMPEDNKSLGTDDIATKWNRRHNPAAEALPTDVNDTDVVNMPKGITLALEELTSIFNAGYSYGHHVTVESMYTDIHYSEVETFHREEVVELLEVMEKPLPPAPETGGEG